MTKKELTTMKFQGYFERIIIGKSWETKREIFVNASDREITIVVVGRPRYGEYLIHAVYPYTEMGFESAKKFALKRAR